MEKIFQSDYSMYSQIVSCLVILGFTQMAICFKVAMFDGLTSCVSFDYVILIIIIKHTQIFLNFFSSQVIITLEIIKKPTV